MVAVTISVTLKDVVDSGLHFLANLFSPFAVQNGRNGQSQIKAKYFQAGFSFSLSLENTMVILTINNKPNRI